MSFKQALQEFKLNRAPLKQQTKDITIVHHNDCLTTAVKTLLLKQGIVSSLDVGGFTPDKIIDKLKQRHIEAELSPVSDFNQAKKAIDDNYDIIIAFEFKPEYHRQWASIRDSRPATFMNGELDYHQCLRDNLNYFTNLFKTAYKTNTINASKIETPSDYGYNGAHALLSSEYNAKGLVCKDSTITRAYTITSKALMSDAFQLYKFKASVEANYEDTPRFDSLNDFTHNIGHLSAKQIEIALTNYDFITLNSSIDINLINRLLTRISTEELIKIIIKRYPLSSSLERYYVGLLIDNLKDSYNDKLIAFAHELDKHYIASKLNEINLKHAAAAAALGTAALTASDSNAPKYISSQEASAEVHRQSFKAWSHKQEELANQLAANAAAKYKHVDKKLITKIAKLAVKHAKPDFPKADDIMSIVGIESTFNPDAKSALKHDPALGLTQVRPKVWGINPASLKASIEAQVKTAADILHSYYNKLKDKDDAVEAYNVGITHINNGTASNPNYVMKFKNEKKLYNQ